MLKLLLYNVSNMERIENHQKTRQANKKWGTLIKCLKLQKNHDILGGHQLDYKLAVSA
jgi:hypothetical protein